jgi:beta-galactosidase
MAAHPEILARPLGGADCRLRHAAEHGHRQSEAYRFYAERVHRNLVEHYKNNPAVIGWQIDNETGSYGASNHDVFVGFVNHLKQKFGTTDALNKAWFLNYWGEDVNDWENMPTRDNAPPAPVTNWSGPLAADAGHELSSWQAAFVREYRRPDQFVTRTSAA